MSNVLRIGDRLNRHDRTMHNTFVRPGAEHDVGGHVTLRDLDREQCNAIETLVPSQCLVHAGCRKAVLTPAFKWVNTALGNIKTGIERLPSPGEAGTKLLNSSSPPAPKYSISLTVSALLAGPAPAGQRLMPLPSGLFSG